MRIPYTSMDGFAATLMPRLPLTLYNEGRTVQVNGLIDSGSSVNVLPYQVGLELGGIWSDEQPSVPLAGNLAAYETRGFAVWAFNPELTGSNPVRLVFAWVKSDNAPVIFGQMNFFLEFDVCFYRSQSWIEIHRRT